MEKKYQVFVSSTYQDLIEERQKVIEALLGKNCFPVGMEYFPAANDGQFTVIKKLIDRCDYYILIIGGRYGSIEPKSGKSYTQLEFEYAISRGIPVASFYHAEPSKLPAERVESTDEGKRKLGEFKKNVQEKLCDSWKEPYELAFKVSKSLDYLFENSLRVGWVKADEISSAEANKEILSLKKENEKLLEQVNRLSLRAPIGSENFQQGNDVYNIIFHKRLSFWWDHDEEYEEKDDIRRDVSWNEIFLSIAPGLFNPVPYTEIQNYLFKPIHKLLEISEQDYIIDKKNKEAIEIQLLALGLIETDKVIENGVYTYCTLTPYGRAEMVKLKAIKK